MRKSQFRLFSSDRIWEFGTKVYKKERVNAIQTTHYN